MNNQENIWIKGDAREKSYQFDQYAEPKVYTQKIVEYLKTFNLLSKGTRTVDFGCGQGATTNYFAKHFPGTQFDGFDLNPEYIKIANEHRQPNSHFYSENFNESLSLPFKKYDGVFSIQTFSWCSGYKKQMKKMFDLSPDWILVTSLFYDGPVEAIIQVTDYTRKVGKHNFRRSSYNIYSIDKLEKFLETQAYYIDKKLPFIFPSDLPRPKDKSLGTYTVRIEDGSRLQISGPILMSWYTLLIRRK